MSTICSKIFGPAIFPSLLICPIKKIGIDVFFAKFIAGTDVKSFDKEEASSAMKNSGTKSEELNSFPNKKGRRNSPCPCGSGKKFKHCCGAI